MYRRLQLCPLALSVGKYFCTSKPPANQEIKTKPQGPLEKSTSSLDIETRRKKLFFQSRYRGMAEMEYILHTYAEKYLEKMPAADLDQWENILCTGDSELYKWIVQKKDDAVKEEVRQQKVSRHLLDSLKEMRLDQKKV